MKTIEHIIKQCIKNNYQLQSDINGVKVCDFYNPMKDVVLGKCPYIRNESLCWESHGYYVCKAHKEVEPLKQGDGK